MTRPQSLRRRRSRAMSSPTLDRTATPGIYKRGGRYVVVRRDLSGRQRKLFARTLAEARRLKGKPPEDVQTRRVAFVEYAQEWIPIFNGLTRRGIGQTTLEDYAALLGLTTRGELLQPERGAVKFFGRMRLEQITTPDLRRYAAVLFERGLTRSSVLKELAPVRALLTTAHNDGLIRHNPARGLIVQAPVEDELDERSVEEQEQVKALTEDELRRLLELLPLEWPQFFRFLAETGLRIGEAIEFRYGDVEGTWLNVDRRYYRGRVGLPKGRKKRRVPISTELAQELWTRRKELHARDDDLVWTSARGKRIVPSNLMSRVLKPAAVGVGLGEWVSTKDGNRAESWVGFHTFRHTTATRLFVGQAWNAVQVCRFLGHSDPGFTLRTYVHLLPEDLPAPDFRQEGATRGQHKPPKSAENGVRVTETEAADLQPELSAAFGVAGV
jgi:integrase